MGTRQFTTGRNINRGISRQNLTSVALSALKILLEWGDDMKKTIEVLFFRHHTEHELYMNYVFAN